MSFKTQYLEKAKLVRVNFVTTRTYLYTAQYQLNKISLSWTSIAQVINRILHR